MKKILAALAAVLLFTGCKTNPGNARLLAHTAAHIGTSILMEEHPDTRPYMLTAAAVICEVSKGTNASPQLVIDSLSTLPIQSPYGAAFVNFALTLYFANYEHKKPEANEVLIGTCSGMNLGLMSGARTRSYPHLRMR